MSRVTFDFFLASHSAIKGTSRIPHYHVLKNSANLDADQVHKLTFELCHMYARSTRLVSIPAPTYYAHLAAEKAPFLMTDFKEFLGGFDASSATGTHASGRSDASAEFVEVPEALQHKLYYL